MQDHIDTASMTRQGFVDTVIDDFLSQVVGARVGIHARTTTNRIQAAEHLDSISIIICGQRFLRKQGLGKSEYF